MAKGPTRTDDFRTALLEMFREAEAAQASSIEVTSKMLATRVGPSKRGKYDEMEMATKALRSNLREEGDEIRSSPPKGRGSSFRAVFLLPRDGDVPSGVHSKPSVDAAPTGQTSYFEGRKMLREILTFYRNPKLVERAKAEYGHVCQACGFDFQARYGDLGAGYIECHHIDPISGRGGENTPTTIKQVAMLCANCHRMIHRMTGAMTVPEFREHLEQPDGRSSGGEVAT